MNREQESRVEFKNISFFIFQKKENSLGLEKE
jgi:hypothetical protein